MKASNQISTVSIIGSGNVATGLGLALKNANVNISEVYSPTAENAKLLATKLNCISVNSIENLSDTSDLYLIAISDDEIVNLKNTLIIKQGIIAHTSGSQSINTLCKNTGSFGVFYPLQTMTKVSPPNFKDIPVCIEASDEKTKAQLTDLAKKISNNVVSLTSDQRQYLHLTAVTVNNFTNLLYNHAHDVLREKNIDFSLLLPLIHETAIKVHNTTPKEAQTGPARRNDVVIINKHLKLLENYPDYRDLYSLLSKQLIKKYHG